MPGSAAECASSFRKYDGALRSSSQEGELSAIPLNAKSHSQRELVCRLGLPHPGVRRPPAAWRGGRSPPVRHPRDRDVLAASLLEASLPGGVPAAGRESGPGDRGGRRGGEENADGSRATRSGGDLGPRSPEPSQEDQEVAGSALPCGQQGHAPLPRGLRLVCGGLSHGRREAPAGRSHREVPARELPASVAVCRRVGQALVFAR